VDQHCSISQEDEPIRDEIIGGKYKLLKNGLLSRGDYWDVWKAKDTDQPSGRVVAVKTIRQDIPYGAMMHFSTQISTIAKLEHPHIIPIYDWDRDNASYLVMRLVTGGNLYDKMPSLARPTISRYLIQIASALQYAHSLGVVHGNLVPENVLFDDKIDHPYLINFGTIYEFDETYLKKQHIPPEQLSGNLVPQSDQYMLSVIAYEMLTGKKTRSIGDKIAMLPPAPELLDQSVYKVLARACSSLPENRFPNIVAFIDALQTALEFGKDPSNLRDEEQNYLAALITECEQRIRGYINLAGKKRDVIVSPISETKIRTGAGRVFIRHPVRYQAQKSIAEEPDVPTDDVRDTMLRLDKTVLLGDPGSGKTTTLLQLALECAHKAQLDPQAPIPVFIPLTLFQGDIPFVEFVRQQMYGLEPHLEKYLATPEKTLLLFDALNETTRSVKSDVVEYLASLPRFVVSCRTKDYNQELGGISDLSSVTILDLDLPRIKRAMALRIGEKGHRLWADTGGNDQLLDFWNSLQSHGEQSRFWFLDKAPKYTKVDADAAWNLMHERAVLPLCRNPFMLALVCDLYDQEGHIPSNRGELFEQFVKISIDSEIARIANVEAWAPEDRRYLTYKNLVLDILTLLAKEIQLGQLGTGISSELACHVLSDGWSTDQIELGLTIARDSGVVSLSSSASTGTNKQILFSHQLIQEYFASEILTRSIDSDPQVPATNYFNPSNWWEPQGWEETVIILAGVKGKKEVEKVIRWVAEAQPSLAVRCIEDSGIPGVGIDTLGDELRKWLQEKWLKRIDDRSEPIRARSAIAVALSKIGDPRKGVGNRIHSNGSVPDIEWIPLPELKVSISRFPVTHSQFASFVCAKDGYHLSKWWEFAEDAKQWHERFCAPFSSKYSVDNLPRVEVNWYEAKAFCHWLSFRLSSEIRLPTESEWIFADVGMSHNSYPWGDQYQYGLGNVTTDSEKAVGDLCSVGIFPFALSYCGAADLVGNTWEWCEDIFEVDRNSENNDLALYQLSSRILKGGSWTYRPEFAVAGYRFWSFPNLRSKDVGFRVVCLL
jgi:serine/threonine protein kinase